MKKIILMTVGACVATNAFAGGYRVALQGQKALGMGHTGVAMTESAEVVFFNPASMSLLEEDAQFIGGITLIDGVTKYQNTTTNTAAETDNPVGTPVGIYYTKKHNKDLSYGLGIYTPYGNSVEWPTDWAGSHLVNNIELAAIFIQPTVSYRLSKGHSVGFGPIYVSGTVEFNRNLSTSLVDGSGNRSDVTIKASGVDSFGFNLGYTGQLSKELTVGVNYRSKIDLEARGETADFNEVPTSFAAVFPDTTFDADLVLPAELTLGLVYAMNGDKTKFAFDINRTFWSEYENLNVQFYNGAGQSLNPRNYQDANILRFGIQHAFNKALTARAGIYFDETPIQPGYFTPETPRNDSIGYTAGVSYRLSKNMEFDASLLILTFDEFSGSYDYYDQSGTTISFGGDYISEVTTLGFGFNYTF